jgi:hypothetical protein
VPLYIDYIYVRVRARLYNVRASLAVCCVTERARTQAVCARPVSSHADSALAVNTYTLHAHASAQSAEQQALGSK